MTLDPRFICTSDLEGVFLDKLTAEPLSGGYINFYVDSSNPTIGKSVYQTTGSPPTGFVPLGDTVTLNSAGGYEDGSGNSIVIYYFPYHCTTDGDPTTSTGVIELYACQVFNSGNQLQFTREAWPPLASNLAPSGNSSTAVLNYNYIPNGQFLANINTAAQISTTIAPNAVTQIAQGGWYFKESTGGTGVYTVSFIQESRPNFSSGLQDAPYYSASIVGTSGTETVRDLVVQWPNVNTFSNSANPTNQYNLSFSGASLNGITQTFAVYLISNYGSGGSTEVDTLLGNVSVTNVTNSYSLFNLTVNMPNNSAKTVGANNYLAIAIRMPVASTSVKFTDFSLTFSATTRSSFPVQTPADVNNQFFPTPASDGSSLYLPLALTPNGYIFDNSEVGNIVAKTTITEFTNSISTISNELLCDGSQYAVAGYSPLGIPYARLFNKIFLAYNAMAIWGNGANFVNALTYGDSAGELILCTNKIGSVTAPANGSTSPGFSYAKSGGTGGNTAGSTTRGFVAFANQSGEIYAKCTTLGTATTISLGTSSGITAADIINSSVGYYQFYLVVPVATTLSNGASVTAQYIEFSNTTTTYRLWFNVAGETAPAAGGHTLVQVQLDSSMGSADVAAVVANTISAYQTNIIQCAAASSVAQSSWFTFFAGTNQYTVWYNKASGGTQPTVAGTVLYIPVALTGTETATQVAIFTQTAINSQYFAVPDLRGLFLRGYDPTSIWDNQLLERVSNALNIIEGSIGTIEWSSFSSHTHVATSTTTLTGMNATAANQTNIASGSTTGSNNYASGNLLTATTNAVTGIYETRPVNSAVAWAIKY